MSKLRLYWRQLSWLWVSAVMVVLDQLSKKAALLYLGNGVDNSLFPLLNFTLAYNRGAAFSFLNAASGWQNMFFIVLASVFSCLLMLWLLQSRQRHEALGISLVIGGAWGNLLDRLHYGFVIDFIDVHLGVYHWPIFNMADSAICCGIFILFFSHFLCVRLSAD